MRLIYALILKESEFARYARTKIMLFSGFNVTCKTSRENLAIRQIYENLPNIEIHFQRFFGKKKKI